MFDWLKRSLVGRALSNEQSGHTLLPKRLALPVFCSDPLSSVAYATEQVLLVLVMGGIALLSLTPAIAACVVLLLTIVVASYMRTVYAYPSGGGAYAVAKDNFGRGVSLTAAGALIVDYILTVSVSVTAGMTNVVSAFPSLSPHLVSLCLAVVAIITLVNLRGIKESGSVFALPTYMFIASLLVMFGVAAWRNLSGDPVIAESASYELTEVQAYTALGTLFLLLRAFASGCTALTGVEAISNGVPYFRKPKSRNAALTLLMMGIISITLFSGVTWLAVSSGVQIAEHPEMLGLPAGAHQNTVIAQIAAATFGSSSWGFYLVQATTALVLFLAANTAYNSFPMMASVLGRDGFLPRQFGRRGDRLVFSNGVLILSGFAALLIYMFDASVFRLIQLYILGVFLGFTISQAGMVKYWRRFVPETPAQARMARASKAINTLGAMVTATVLVIVVFSKFSHGAWMVLLAIPIFVILMLAINRHYRSTDERLLPTDRGITLPARVYSIVLVAKLNAPAQRAIAYARASRPSTLVGLHVATDEESAETLRREWLEKGVPIPLEIIDSPFRDLTAPVLEYVRSVRRDSPRDLVTVYVPEYVVNHWWQTLLHNQSALRLKSRLLFQQNVIVVSVPQVLGAHGHEAMELPEAEQPEASGTTHMG